MRLINVHTLDLEDFWGKDPPAYAILSHTWGTEEVSFQDWKARTSISHKAGFDKIIKVAQIAEKLDLNYVWVDTNCIDKTSSAELSEAINSMFAWYSKAEWCLVHLDDIPSIDDPTLRGRSAGYTLEALQHSRWFTRGWTLQELIAPACLAFFSQNWQIIGYLRKEKIVDTISHITGIARATLVTKEDYVNESIAVRMHWASKRRTTRVEDMAYCLFGLFNINLPLLYGEGKAAFQRLQEEIMKVSIDQSIFAWSSESLDLEQDLGRISLMAPWPSAFNNKHIVKTKTSSRAPIDSVYTLENYGLSIQLPLLMGQRRESKIHVFV
ncbi:heterokaryon incompatibility protein-domain-containing protein [Hypoxylon argillaceum]|nr:heterokaryon incompatibility protein-domain-containing protein [Hypoxylon argillaceum]